MEVMNPEAIDKHKARGSPDIRGGGPQPAGPKRRPESRSPEVTILLINPASGHITAIVVRSRWQSFRDRLGRGWKYLFFALGLHSPVAGHPLPAFLLLLPVTGDPVAAGEADPPDAAHPEKIIAVVIKGPVAGNPLRAGLFGLLLGGQFVYRLRRVLCPAPGPLLAGAPPRPRS